MILFGSVIYDKLVRFTFENFSLYFLVKSKSPPSALEHTCGLYYKYITIVMNDT